MQGLILNPSDYRLLAFAETPGIKFMSCFTDMTCLRHVLLGRRHDESYRHMLRHLRRRWSLAQNRTDISSAGGLSLEGVMSSLAKSSRNIKSSLLL